ncbi:hypothetical protein BD413DRAFT_474886 [Trametes elegans]|nr:hypothetical protein BD413DRAFT_474886 [Trametes elegans]
MLEPLAATVLSSILPSQPLASQVLAYRSAFGMAVRSATHALPHDFFTPHSSAVKGKGRALPELEDEQRAYCSSSDGAILSRCEAISEQETVSPTLPSALLARQRTRRTPGHRCIATGSGSQIPSLRTWMRQVHTVQRRHASSRPALETTRHPHDAGLLRNWIETFRKVAMGAGDVHPEEAWQAYESIRLHTGDNPGPPPTVLAFLANVVLSVVSSQPRDLSADLMQHWGHRLQEALHHVDPGIGHMPNNTVRTRWNGLQVAARAMLGELDEAVDAAAMLYHHVHVRTKVQQRGHILEVYTILICAVHQCRGPCAVLDTLLENLWLRKYLTGQQPPPRDIVPAVNRLKQVSLSLLSAIQDPVDYIAHSSKLWCSPRLRLTMGELLIRAMAESKRDPYPVFQALQRESLRIPEDIVFLVVRQLARTAVFDVAHSVLETVPKTDRIKDAERPNTRYHSMALYLCSRQGDVTRAQEHYRLLADVGRVKPEDKAALLRAHATAGNPDRVAEVFHKLFATPSDQNGPRLVHYTSVISAYANAGDMDGVNVWLGHLSEAGFRPDVHIYGVILQCFAVQGDIASMTALLDQMRDSSVAPTLSIYTTLISTLAKRQDPQAAECIYKRAIEEGIVPDRQMITALMNAYAEAGSWHGVLRAFDYLTTDGRAGAILTTEVLNTLMKAYVLIGAPFRLVAKLLRQYHREGIQSDARTFALLMQSACDAGYMDIAEHVLKEMDRLAMEGQAALAPNVYVMTVLMRGYLLTGRRIKAKGVLDRMKERGIKPNAVTYAAIMQAYTQQRTEQGVEVAEELLNSLVNDKLEEPWMQLEGGRAQALETVFQPLVYAYARRAEAAEVERIYQNLISSGGEPTLGIMTALLDVHRRQGDVGALRQTWLDVHRLGLEYSRRNDLLGGAPDAPNAPTSLQNHGRAMCVPLSIYIDGLSAGGAHAEVARVWKALKDAGLPFDSHNWNHLVVALVRAGEPHRAFDVVENVILRFQQYVERQLGEGGARDRRPDSPLAPALPPVEEGDLPPPRVEAPLRNAVRRAEQVRRVARRTQRAATGDGEDEGEDGDDFAHPLEMLQQLSPMWNTWRPHGATLVLLGRVLAHLRSGHVVQPVRPGADVSFEQAALDEAELSARTAAAAKVLGGIYDAFPRTVRLVEEYELLRRSVYSRKTTAQRY